MLRDVLGSLVGVLAFAGLLYAPGYLAAWATNLLGFRHFPFAERSMWAILCSFGLCPITAYLLSRSLGFGSLRWVAIGCGFATACLLWSGKKALHWSRQEQRLTVLVAGGWTLLVLLLLVDFQVGHKLYYSVVMADGSYRIAFTDAVARTGVPPANPLYFAGSPAPMRYYYFWYVLCAAVVRLAGVSARQAFFASSVWAGFGLLATVWLFSSHFFQWKRPHRWLAMGLLLVTGADLVPAVGQALLQPTLNGDTEWWSVDPIDGWPDSLLWVPHHVASVLCCLLTFLLLWRTRSLTDRRMRRWAVSFAATAFASAFGLSVYVSFGFAVMMSAWLAWLWLRHDPQRRALTTQVFGTAAVSCLLLLPFLHELASPSQQHGAAAKPTSDFPFTLSVRRMIDSGLVTGAPVFQRLDQTQPLLLDQGVRLFLLFPGLAMELGVYGAVLVALAYRLSRQKRAAPHPARDTALFFAVCGLALTLFVSSAVITNNDFGYRAVMLPQFFLLLLTADFFGSWRTAESSHADASPAAPVRSATRNLFWGLLVLGGAGTVYWAFLLRAWLPVEAAHPQTGYLHSPEENYQIREAFEQMDQVAARDAVIAFRPIDPTPDRQGAVMLPNEYYQRMLVMDSGRQMLNAEGKCAVHFGGDAGACPSIQQAIQVLYATPHVPEADQARQFCHRFGVSYLVLSAWDAAFQVQRGWPAELPVVVAEPRIRILRCS